MMLGSIIPALAKAGLFPVPEPEKFTGSIVTLKNELDNVKTIPYVGKEWMPHTSHENCNLGFRESVIACLKEMIVPLSAGISKWPYVQLILHADSSSPRGDRMTSSLKFERIGIECWMLTIFRNSELDV